MQEGRVIRRCLPPFQEFRSSGPYIMMGGKGLGRRYINIMGNWGKYRNKTFLYARYLIAVKIGKVPDKGVDVDHIDGNPMNDHIDNLRLVDHVENIRKGSVSDPRVLALRRTLRMNCPHCKALFTKPRNKTHVGKGRGKLTFCSKECAKHHRWVPLGYVQPFEEIATPVISDYSYQESWEKWSTEDSSKNSTTKYNAACACRLRKKKGTAPRMPPKTKKIKLCRTCGKELGPDRNRSIFCESCAKPITRLNDDSYCLEIATKAAMGHLSWTAAGLLLSVSDNAVRRMAKRLGVTYPVRAYRKEPAEGIEPTT